MRPPFSQGGRNWTAGSAGGAGNSEA